MGQVGDSERETLPNSKLQHVRADRPNSQRFSQQQPELALALSVSPSPSPLVTMPVACEVESHVLPASRQRAHPRFELGTPGFRLAHTLGGARRTSRLLARHDYPRLTI